jgi:hypothetical protein
MAEITPKQNKWAASLVGVVQTIFTVGLSAGKEAIKTQLPFLRLPVISTLFNMLVDYFGDKIDEEIRVNMTFFVVDIQTAKERDEFNKARDALKLVKDTKDQDAINKAREEFKKKLGDLIRHNGT